jgi:hypothetical protein
MTNAICNIPTVHFYSESDHKVICSSLKSKRAPVAPARTMMTHGGVEDRGELHALAAFLQERSPVPIREETVDHTADLEALKGRKTVPNSRR